MTNAILFSDVPANWFFCIPEDNDGVVYRKTESGGVDNDGMQDIGADEAADIFGELGCKLICPAE